jgi:hypothetical protein
MINTPVSKNVMGLFPQIVDRRRRRWRYVLRSYNKHAFCRQFCTRLPLHADYTSPIPIPAESFLFFVVHGIGVGVAWLLFSGGRPGCDVLMHASGRVRGCSKNASLRTFHTWLWSRRFLNHVATWEAHAGSMSRVYVDVSIARWDGGWLERVKGRYSTWPRKDGVRIIGWRLHRIQDSGFLF